MGSGPRAFEQMALPQPLWYHQDYHCHCHCHPQCRCHRHRRCCHTATPSATTTATAPAAAAVHCHTTPDAQWGQTPLAGHTSGPNKARPPSQCALDMSPGSRAHLRRHTNGARGEDYRTCAVLRIGGGTRRKTRALPPPVS